MTGESAGADERAETESPADPVPTSKPTTNTTSKPTTNTTSKPAADDTPSAGPATPERWEEVGRRALGLLLNERKGELDRALADLHATLDYGTPVDPTHLHTLREAIAGLESVVEYDVAELVGGTTAFERTAERVPFGSIVAALDVDTDALDRDMAADGGPDEGGESGRDGASEPTERPADGSIE